ncbi:MAG: hypothetical protein Q7T22_00045, partial [Serpentinimonas sp.]|nr:hypothetical protein [Serpentinimonas sp.]
MPDQLPDKQPHLVLQNTSESKPFKAHSSKGGTKAALPQLDRAQHGAALRGQLQALQPLADAARIRQEEIGLKSGIGLQIQFLS